MMKIKLIMWAVKFIMGAIALGIGIWYLDSSIGGASLSYTSTSNFLKSIGAVDGDVANVNGCFLCGYVRDLFGVLGNATEDFWTLLIHNMWIIMAIGFGVFVVVYTIQYLFDAMKATAKLDESAKNLELSGWFDKVWRQGARVLIAGALIGALGMGGTQTLRTVTNITITPVMYVGAQLSALATGAINGAACETVLADNAENTDILNPVMQPFMCVMGNLNTVVLAGAAGGFALMNYAWLGLGGGVFTWLAGLALVIMFLVIGFDLFFKVLSVVFKLIFLIIFVPIFIAAGAFEPVWKVAGGLVNKAVTMLVKSAVQIVAISLKIVIIFAIISFAASECGYKAVFPPLLGTNTSGTDDVSLAVTRVFQECEAVSITDGQVDADKFKPCFIRKRDAVEAQYPGAFDFMDDGWDFIMMMIGIFFLYFYAIGPRVDAMLGKDGKEEFDFGGWVKDFGKTVYNAPQKLLSWGLNKYMKK